MDRIIERLPSPAGVALWLYALAFIVLPALLAYKGFVYVLGIIIFAVGIYPNIQDIVAGRPVHFAFSWRGRKRVWDIHLGIPNEKVVIKTISIGLILFTMLVVPFLLFILQYQGMVFYRQIEAQMPVILEGIDWLMKYAHDTLPGYVPDVEVDEGGGWKGLGDSLGVIMGDAIKDIKSMVKSALSGLVQVVGLILAEWIKLVIAAIIVGTMLGGWKKEVKMHRTIISNGIKDPKLRANVLRFGELFQTGISLFMIGYLEVALTLTLFYVIAMTVLPFGLGIGAILFMSIVLGFITAIPKIGGILCMFVGGFLMLTNLNPGLGWFGFTVITFGAIPDMLIRLVLMLITAKLMGVLEAYSYTPEIIGQRLGMTKMQIIATVLVWALGAGFFGMIWGVLLSLAFQAALRLSEELKAEETAHDTPAESEAGA